ncbi:hypothetical protein PISMIDRAFT_116379, partial [Pisolithus microcarpus 441]
ILKYLAIGASTLHIQYKDLEWLAPKEWLNDTIIEFGLSLWMNKLKMMDPHVAHCMHIFSPFFYTKFRSGK